MVERVIVCSLIHSKVGEPTVKSSHTISQSRGLTNTIFTIYYEYISCRIVLVWCYLHSRSESTVQGDITYLCEGRHYRGGCMRGNSRCTVQYEKLSFSHKLMAYLEGQKFKGIAMIDLLCISTLWSGSDRLKDTLWGRCAGGSH